VRGGDGDELLSPCHSLVPILSQLKFPNRNLCKKHQHTCSWLQSVLGKSGV